MTATREDGAAPAGDAGLADEAQHARAEVLTPIPGEQLDPPPKPKPKAVQKLEGRSPWVTALWKALERFKAARSPLIAGGTAYYAFLAMFSLLAFAYGLVAIFGADALAEWLTDALEEALPGLVGDDGIDPDTLMRVGRTTSVIGLVLMVWSGSAVMIAVSDALHQIYGAAPDGRNLLARRGHLLAWLAVLGPLIVLSFTLTTAASGFGHQLLDELGLESSAARFVVLALATLLTFVLDVGIMWLFLSRLGGIGPSARSVLVGAIVGAVIVGVLKVLMANIISWSVDKPEYGSFALPIAILVVLWLQSMGLYGAACVTAGLAETRHVYGADDAGGSSIEDRQDGS